MSPKKKPKVRTRTQLQTKLNIIRLNEQGMTHGHISRKLGIPRSTISSIIQRKHVIHARSNLNESTQAIRMDHLLIREMEEHLIVWIQKQIKMNIILGPRIVKNKAKNIFDKIKAQRGELVSEETFGASKSWFDNFQKRAKLSIKSTLHEYSVKKTVSDESGIISYKWPHGEKEDKSNIIQRETNSPRNHQTSCSSDINIADRSISPSILSDDIKVEAMSDDYDEFEEMLADDCLPYLKEEEEDPLEPERITSNLPAKTQGTSQEKSKQNLEEHELFNSNEQIMIQETFQEKSDFNSFSGYLKKNSDEHQLFGDFVAQELRDLRSDKLQKKLKRKILQFVIQIGEEDDL